MKKSAFYDKTQMLFVESGLTLTRISELTSVSTRTLGDWKKDGNWDEKRKNYIKMQNSCCANLYKMLNGLTNQVNGQLMNAEPVDMSLVSSIEKIAKSIPKLRPYEKDTIKEETQAAEPSSKIDEDGQDLSVRIAELVDAKLTGEI